MNSEDLQNLLSRIDERQAAQVERYQRDREEARQRDRDDRQERDKWRTGVENKIDKLNEKFTPVLRDHQMIVRAGKWLAGLIAAAWAAFKGWLFVQDHWK